jgi:hypothetical protein
MSLTSYSSCTGDDKQGRTEGPAAFIQAALTLASDARKHHAKFCYELEYIFASKTWQPMKFDLLILQATHGQTRLNHSQHDVALQLQG